MSEMSKAQGPVGGHVDTNPTDDMVPPAPSQPDPDSPQDRSDYDGSEDVGPQDYGAEDVSPQGYGPEDTNEPPHPAGVSLPGAGDTGAKEGSPPALSSSDPMPDMAGEG
jgi:hypothetical protein